jgi:hypothetical protein
MSLVMAKHGDGEGEDDGEIVPVKMETDCHAVGGTGSFLQDVACGRKMIDVFETDAESGGNLLYEFLDSCEN